eukprot:TRINITY_DN3430_c0_g1_i14.p1 TRINITY_DN3430_c0_g1~~TRINITY_DN3430_c0_g1_i14.p1  ORF type:complete len:713 (-),score=258.61 TRINITY_DN3430_c0_g1_i14:400-2538(-)
MLLLAVVAMAAASVHAQLQDTPASRETFDCPMRYLAMEYAAELQPWRPSVAFSQLAAALNGTPEKPPGCTVEPAVSMGVAGGSRFRHAALAAPGPGSVMLFVDAVHGSDSNDGSIDSPLLTIDAALAASRKSPGYDSIVLRAGTFYQKDTLVLGAEDTGLTIQAYPGEEVWISGARPLTGVSWKPYNVSAGRNIWQASLAGMGFDGVPGLRYNGTRLIRARFPNSNPETDGFGATFNAAWTPQSAPRVPSVQIDLAQPVRNTSASMFQTFTAGVGGTCDRFQPDAGYWCSVNVQGGGSVIYFVPTAMQVTQSIVPNTPYKNASTAVIQTWRPGHWASWMFTVADATFNASSGTTNFTFSAGGFQGSRGENQGAETYIENVFEELDAPAEWFYDENSQVLYLWHNASSGTAPPTDGTLVVPQLRHLINVSGTQAVPVVGLSLIGVGLRDTRYTYMDPHGIPSGGDWTLARSAAVLLEGTEQARVSGCVFERIDGSAILVSAYNRNATIQYNEFYYIGESCIASWGNTEGGDIRLPEGYGLDGTQGNQPRFNQILYNWAHEIGIWEKQSSFYTQFKTMLNHVEGNVVYNGPRAHINFNDGFGGGTVIEKNLLLNSCRESGDHGPFNSWDRDPYIFDGPDGQPTVVKQMDHIRSNFVIANYNSLGAVDNDDGSSYYYTWACPTVSGLLFACCVLSLTDNDGHRHVLIDGRVMWDC